MKKTTHPIIDRILALSEALSEALPDLKAHVRYLKTLSPASLVLREMELKKHASEKKPGAVPAGPLNGHRRPIRKTRKKL